MGYDITSVNAILILSVDVVFPTSQQIQQFSADDIYGIDQQDASETSMGVDGNLSGGFVFKSVMQKIKLQANSPSVAFFQTWYQQMKANNRVFAATGSITIPALNKKYTQTRGFLKNWKPIPDAKKMMEAQEFAIEWNFVDPAPYGQGT